MVNFEEVLRCGVESDIFAQCLGSNSALPWWETGKPMCKEQRLDSVSVSCLAFTQMLHCVCTFITPVCMSPTQKNLGLLFRTEHIKGRLFAKLVIKTFTIDCFKLFFFS